MSDPTPTPESETPRTDAEAFTPRGIYIGERLVGYNFARTLERELTLTQSELAKAKEERDEKAQALETMLTKLGRACSAIGDEDTVTGLMEATVTELEKVSGERDSLKADLARVTKERDWLQVLVDLETHAHYRAIVTQLEATQKELALKDAALEQRTNEANLAARLADVKTGEALRLQDDLTTCRRELAEARRLAEARGSMLYQYQELTRDAEKRASASESARLAAEAKVEQLKNILRNAIDYMSLTLKMQLPNSETRRIFDAIKDGSDKALSSTPSASELLKDKGAKRVDWMARSGCFFEGDDAGWLVLGKSGQVLGRGNTPTEALDAAIAATKEKPAPQPAATPKPHNPDNLTPEQVGVADGWRLLDEDELIPKGASPFKRLEAWMEQWSPGYYGELTKLTYRTKLTRAELRKARGLNP